MSGQKKAGTISALLIGLLALIVAFSSLATHVSAIARLQNATLTPTPCTANPDDCTDYATDDAMDAMTASADAMTAAAMGTAVTTSSTQVATSTVVGSPAATPPPALSPTSFTGAATLAPSPTQPAPIVEPQQVAPTETPTVIPDSALICYPGIPLVITGDGPAHAAFLLYFGQRVVSGGSVSSSGRFATSLIVGHERAGIYPISVRVRGTTQALLETNCVVPDITPTLVPRAQELP